MQVAKNSHKGADVIIIGGGVIGLTTGWKLGLSGRSVLLFDAYENSDKNDPFGFENKLAPASLAAAGMLAPSFEIRAEKKLNKPLLDENSEKTYRNYRALCWKSLHLWEGFAPQLEDYCDMSVDFSKTGTIGVCRKDEVEALRKSYEDFRGEGRNIEWLEHADLHSLEPGLNSALVAGYYSPDEKQIDPHLLVKALRSAFVKAGGRIMQPWYVGSICHHNNQVTGVMVSLLDGTNPANQPQKQSKFSASSVLIASGVALAQLKTDFPLPAIFPVKGEALALNMEGKSVDEPIVRHVIRHPEVYLCPKREGRLIVGATSIPLNSERKINPDAIAHLHGLAANLVPAIKHLPEKYRWLGLRPGTPSGLPYIGLPEEKSSIPQGLYFAAGHHRNGILLGPATAKKLVSLVNKTKTDIPDIAFHL